MTLGLVTTASAAAPTIYVSPTGSDTAACTPAAPCKSFDRAYRVASAGSEVEVAGGTYAGQDLVNVPAKSTTERIVIRPAPGATVKIGYLSVNNTHNVEIRGMETDGWGVTGGSTSVILRDISAFDEHDGGYFAGAHDVQILGGEIGRIDPGDGIHFNNAGGNTNTNITIDGLFMHDLTRNVDPAAHTDCVQTGDVTGLVIRNSRFVNCATQGVFLNPYNGGATKNITLENNWFGPAQLGYNSLYIGDATNVTVRNNSFTQNMYLSPTAVNVSVVNNILGGMDAYGCQSTASNAVVFDYNMSAASCTGAAHHTVNASLLSQYASTNASPSTAFDLHLKAGAAAIDKGSPTDFAPTDFDGHARPSGAAPDTGADEYGSTGGTTPPPPPPSNAAPDTSISAGPTGSTTATDASFSFTGSDDTTPAGSLSFACKLDAGAWAACTSPQAYTGLALGSHTFSVRATDGNGATDASPATRSWTVTAPGSSTTLVGNENVETLVDRLLGGQAEAWPFTAAASGTAGSVTAYVDATSTATGAEIGIYSDSAGLPGVLLGKGTLTSPTAGWNTAAVPGFSVTAGATYWVALIATGTGELRFRDHPTGGACLARLSATNTWTSLPGTWSGTGTASECPLSAYVSSSGGGTPPPADTTAPDTAIGSGPAASTTSTSASFTFSGSDDVTAAGSLGFECQLDTAGWAACSSPKAYSGLAVGAHTFSVRAKDAAGNVDGSPASASWTITTPPDTTAPDTAITSAPANPTSATSATFAFSGTDNVTPASALTFQCSLDLGAWTACTTPKTYSGLAVGNHSVRVRAKDAAGNIDGSAASYSWTITPPDTTPPNTTIGSGPDTLSLATSATFTFSGTDNVTAAGALAFSCSLDGGPWTACASPATYGGLALLGHTFAVRAIDGAGNIDPTPAVHSWSVLAPTLPGTTDPGPPPWDPSAPTSGTSPRTTDPAPPAGGPTVPNTPAPTPATDPAGTPAPTVALAAPTAGAAFASKLPYAATAAASKGATVKRVEFWFDGARVAKDLAAPYAYTWKVTSGVSAGMHTASVRVYDTAGRVASAATTVLRTSGTTAATREQAAADAVVASVTARSAADGGTQVDGLMRAGNGVRVRLGPCVAKSARATAGLVLRPVDGRLSGHHGSGRLCIVGLAPPL